jgi:hypothetical protein
MEGEREREKEREKIKRERDREREREIFASWCNCLISLLYNCRAMAYCMQKSGPQGLVHFSPPLTSTAMHFDLGAEEKTDSAARGPRRASEHCPGDG